MRSIFIVFVSLILIGGCGNTTDAWHTKDISGLMPPLDFTLIDETGEVATAEDFRGKPALLFFGFTHCPDVCPTTLARLNTIADSLEQPDKDDVQILFVSVDPERDRPRDLKQYTDAFGKRVVGLTGDKAALDALTRRYRVTYSYGKKDASGDYQVSHASAVFAFRRSGESQLLIRDSDPDEGIREDLARLLDQS